MFRRLLIALVATLTAQAAGFLIVANKGDQTLGIIDTKTGKQVSTVPEGGTTGHELTASPDGKLAYVPIYGKSGVGQPGPAGTTMVVIDLATCKKVVGNLDFGRGVRPHLPMFDPKNGMRLYRARQNHQASSIPRH